MNNELEKIAAGRIMAQGFIDELEKLSGYKRQTYRMVKRVGKNLQRRRKQIGRIAKASPKDARNLKNQRTDSINKLIERRKNMANIQELKGRQPTKFYQLGKKVKASKARRRGRIERKSIGKLEEQRDRFSRPQRYHKNLWSRVRGKRSYV